MASIAESVRSTRARSLDYARRFVLHMRLPFNYVLAPLFVWGCFVSTSSPGQDFWVGFLAFHVFLYGGTNMFNSYYDRDEGPIGGLARPPSVDVGLLIGALLLKGIGLGLACTIGGAFIVLYLLFTLYSVSYSHPSIRIKSRPIASAVTVFFGQGVVGYMAGWIAAGGSLVNLSSLTGIVGAVGGAIMVSALYPLTQIYQLEEDRRRDDMTLARWLGWRRSFQYILLLLSLGAACIAFVFWQRGFGTVALLVGLYHLGALIYLARLRRRLWGCQRQVIYQRVMAFNYTNSTLLLSLLGIHIILGAA